MINLDHAMAYLGFVEARHEVWEARQAGKPQPWTTEPIVATRKFTNVFRVLDPGSQFVLTDLLEPELAPEEFLMRCFLYRHTNLPQAWEAYRDNVGRYPLRQDLDDLRDFWLGYRALGGRVFSGAYMIYPQSATPGTDKVESIIDLTKRLFVSSQRVLHDFFTATSQTERFAALRTNKGVADFMSMQILTDYGYSTEDRENEFIVLGPGARKGALALDPTAKPERTFEWAVEAVRGLENCPVIETHDNVLRQPSLMDIQNTLCEFSKWVRFAEKPIPDKLYRPAHPGPQEPPVLPKHW